MCVGGSYCCKCSSFKCFRINPLKSPFKDDQVYFLSISIWRNLLLNIDFQFGPIFVWWSSKTDKSQDNLIIKRSAIQTFLKFFFFLKISRTSNVNFMQLLTKKIFPGSDITIKSILQKTCTRRKFNYFKFNLVQTKNVWRFEFAMIGEKVSIFRMTSTFCFNFVQIKFKFKIKIKIKRFFLSLVSPVTSLLMSFSCSQEIALSGEGGAADVKDFGLKPKKCRKKKKIESASLNWVRLKCFLIWVSDCHFLFVKSKGNV